jgi:hypothetical protein
MGIEIIKKSPILISNKLLIYALQLKTKNSKSGSSSRTFAQKQASLLVSDVVWAAARARTYRYVY